MVNLSDVFVHCPWRWEAWHHCTWLLTWTPKMEPWSLRCCLLACLILTAELQMMVHIFTSIRYLFAILTSVLCFRAMTATDHWTLALSWKMLGCCRATCLWSYIIAWKFFIEPLIQCIACHLFVWLCNYRISIFFCNCIWIMEYGYGINTTIEEKSAMFSGFSLIC